MRRRFFQFALLVIASATAVAAGPPGDNVGPAVTLYRQLRDLGLDPARVYHIRDVGLDHAAIHITLNSGTIAFSQTVEGRVTGAFFEGDGEILLVPPNRVERASMALFTGAPILEERFVTAFFRFNDDTVARLQPSLRPAEQGPEFLARWEPAFRELCVGDAFELLRFLTWQGPSGATPGSFFHARLAGLHLGTFDVFFDTENAEQVSVGQGSSVNGAQIFDVWASFATRNAGSGERDNVTELGRNSVRITASKIRTHILPSRELEAEAQLTLEATRSGARTLVFELSRYLKVSSVVIADAPLEFIQNESLQGGDLARRGNDLVAVVLPRPLQAGEKSQLRFNYSGSVMSEAGGGLMYVGARGIWYPNLGPAMSDFELEFRYPAGWTLVATGKRTSLETVGAEQISRWVSERPIPLAGFNLGKYKTARARAAETVVEVFATPEVERSFPQTRAKSLDLPPFSRPGANMMPPPPPAPSAESQAVAQRSTRALEFFSRHFGPFPYSSLAVTQMPGPISQGWPGLVFLSSYAFLNAEERERLHLSKYEKLLYGELVQAHETAHQWWGDAVLWKSYRDGWLFEALANYSALLALEAEKPDIFRAALEQYRQDLARKWHDGPPMKDAGPVTLGHRLTSSRLPEAYEVVLYGRGTWLLHMLREMFRDADRESADPDARFFQVLRGVRERFDGRTLSTQDFQKALEEALPVSLRYEGKRSLAWFFDGWVNGVALAHWQLSGVKFTHKNDKRFVTGTLLQQDAPDTLVTSVPLYANTEGGKRVYLGRVFADGPETEFRLPVPAGARGLVIDPHHTVLTRP
ncbi:MAG TPA: M1 family aminopeptidase [Terriglobales bacterium]|nr:M1 family aminopeptidase [Terriglobales bacterium]